MRRSIVDKAFFAEAAAALTVILVQPSPAPALPKEPGSFVASELSGSALGETIAGAELPTGGFTMHLDLQGAAEALTFEPSDLFAGRYTAEIESEKGTVRETPSGRFFRAVFKTTAEPGWVRLGVLKSIDRSKTAILGLANFSSSFYYLFNRSETPHRITAVPLFEENLRDLARRIGTAKMIENLPGGIKPGAAEKMKSFGVATDSDYETTQEASERGFSANAELLAHLNMAQGLLEERYPITFKVSYQHSWDVSSVPYHHPDLLTSLKRFMNYWERWFRPRHDFDAALLFAGGPAAQTGSLYSKSVCTPSSYGVLATAAPASYRAFLINEQLTLILGLAPGVFPAACSQPPAFVVFLKRSGLYIMLVAVLSLTVIAVYKMRKLGRVRILRKLLEQQHDPGVWDDLRARQKRAENKQAALTTSERLAQAGVYGASSARRFLKIRLALGAALPLAIYAAGSLYLAPRAALMLGFILFAGGYLAPMRWLDKAVAQRRDEITRALPGFVEQMRICITGSLDIWSSIEECLNLAVARGSGSAITAVLLRTKSLVQAGMPTGDALRTSAKETGVLELEHVFAFFTQVAIHGGEITKQMEALSDSALQNHHLRIEGKIASLAVAATFPLMLVFAGFFGMLLAGMAAHFSSSITF